MFTQKSTQKQYKYIFEGDCEWVGGWSSGGEKGREVKFVEVRNDFDGDPICFWLAIGVRGVLMELLNFQVGIHIIYT